jgi:hypothetical protein
MLSTPAIAAGTRQAMHSARLLVSGAVPAVVLALLLVGSPAGAQTEIDIRTILPRPEQPGPAIRPEEDDAVRRDRLDDLPRPRPGIFFLGPTGQTRDGRYGLSLWTAPPPAAPGAPAALRDTPGHVGFGFSYTWGGPQAP